MTKKHSYTNPEDKFDASYVEAQVTEGKKYYDKDGWEISPPIQVSRLMDDFKTKKTKFIRNEEYPVL